MTHHHHHHHHHHHVVFFFKIFASRFFQQLEPQQKVMNFQHFCVLFNLTLKWILIMMYCIFCPHLFLVQVMFK